MRPLPRGRTAQRHVVARQAEMGAAPPELFAVEALQGGGAAPLSPASLMGPPLRQVDGTT
jgi:hypothetical protein